MVSQDNTKHGSDMLTRIFCDMDDFCQSFEPELNNFLLESDVIELFGMMREEESLPPDGFTDLSFTLLSAISVKSLT